MRSRLTVGSFVSSIVAALALAGSAQADDFSAEFTTGKDSFQVLNGSFSAVLFDHSTSGGNPGGHISYSDTGSGDDDLINWFVPPTSEVPIDESQIGDVVSFDLRSPGAPATEAFIEVGDQINPVANGRLTCKFGVPDSSWSTYAVRISPDDPCWRDAGGGDADANDFTEVFAVPNVPLEAWVIGADFTSQPNDIADLDNFSMGGVQRDVSIKYKAKSKSFSGKISGQEEAFPDVCFEATGVELYREEGAEDTLLATDPTNSKAKWKIAKPAKKNKRYYALAPASSDPNCAAAQSKTIKPL